MAAINVAAICYNHPETSSKLAVTDSAENRITNNGEKRFKL